MLLSHHATGDFMNRILPQSASFFAAIVVALLATAAEAAKERVLYSFHGASDGGFLEADLYRDAEGNLYGTASEGGSAGCGGGGCGTVFKLTPRGEETTLHAFNGDDGAFPIAGLTADSAGNLYGTTYNGGANTAGTVFKVTPKGKITVLYSFTGGSDGSRPFAGLVADDSGNFFGTTTGGGAYGAGTIFRITPRGKEIVVYSFAGGSDGVYPIGTLLRDPSGNLYGTATNGGIDCDSTDFGCGIVFRLTPDGHETVLYRFEGGKHGANPAAGVVMDGAGTLYGTTNNGGIACDDSGATCGTVYKLTEEGKETALHVFQGGADGAYSKSRLLLDANGNLLGTTAGGGAGGGECGCGIVFRMTLNGAEKILHTFTGSDGHGPFAGLTSDGAGHFYGTADVGGDHSSGTVYEITIRQP
jgi:uncharacterized repeat protein (TIGR03803 family)